MSPKVVFVALGCFAVTFYSSSLLGQDAKKSAYGKLTYVGSITSPKLDSVNSITTDAEGKFVYASSWGANTVNVYARDPLSGSLTNVQEMTSDRDLEGVTSIRLSGDQEYGASAAFRSRTAVLFKRDKATGSLRFMDVARSGEKGVQGMEWAIDVTMSNDHRFVFVADPKGPGAQSPTTRKNKGGIVVFEVTDKDRLKWIETNIGEEDCFDGVRGILMLPDQKTLVATTSTAGKVVVLDWDSDKKKTKIRQIISDGMDKANSLAGAFKSVTSHDGKCLYVSSGRFLGDNAVTFFRMGENGKATFVQELVADFDITDFVGGAYLGLSKDERNLYVTGQRGSSLACFERNLDTGELAYIETISNNSTGFINGACGVCVSPDGRHVYVTVEFGSAIAIFKRDTSG